MYEILTVLSVLILVLPKSGYWEATWLFPWFLILVFVALAAAYKLRKIHLSLFFLAASVLLSSIVTFAYPGNYYSDKFNLMFQLGNGRSSAYSLIAFMALIFWGLNAQIKTTFIGLRLASIITACAVLYLTVTGHPGAERGAFIGNPSMTGCFLACALPLALTPTDNVLKLVANILAACVSILAIIFLEAAIPWVILVAELLAAIVWINQNKFKSVSWRLVLAIVIMAALVFCGLKLTTWSAFVSDNGRFNIYIMGVRNWLAAPIAIKFFGFGLGTTQSMLPFWQATAGNVTEVFPWYHNDWLQAFIELGLIGSVCIIYFSISVFRIALKLDAKYFVTLCGVAAWGMFNYPLRMPIPAMLCSFVVLSVFRIGKKQQAKDLPIKNIERYGLNLAA